MSDILNRLDRLRRPRLLIRAARIGAEDYRRDIHLPRLLGHGGLPRHIKALSHLMEMEAAMDASRRAQEANYSMIQHVEVMIAVIAEARILRASQPTLLRYKKQSTPLPKHIPDTKPELAPAI
ncbi:MAG: DUF6477 family protein [Rhodobacterales bacterium]